MINIDYNQINLQEINSNQPQLEFILVPPNTKTITYTSYKEYDIYYLNKKQTLCLVLDLGLTALNTTNAFSGNLDKFKHTMIVNNVAVVTNRPYASFTGFTIGKELINDKLLKRGTPDLLDVRANSLGVLKYYLEK